MLTYNIQAILYSATLYKKRYYSGTCFNRYCVCVCTVYYSICVCWMCVICPYMCIVYVRVLVFGLMVNYNKSFLDPDTSFVLKVYKDNENSPLSGDCRWQIRFYT